MKRFAVLTSGGDAPGMNAAIRAVVRCGLANGWEMYGVRNGYAGLIAGNFVTMGPRDVGGIMQKGGTVLGSTRSTEFTTIDGQRKAIRALNSNGIDGLFVIGGNGSQTGSFMLSKLNFPVVGIASTIDNDLYGSDITIGVDTALNIALEAVDRLKVTASSHQRAFLLEVMGRNCGYLALMTALAGGAEAVIIPEVEISPEEIAESLNRSYEKGKQHAIVIVAEGAAYNAERLSAYFKIHHDRLGFDLRIAILGHIQRGGVPSAYDRILASRLGAGAVDAMAEGKTGVLTGWFGSKVGWTALETVVNTVKEIDKSLIELAKTLD
ncbi:MAG: 6-phosphofructokinase [Chloroflexi bacterium 44-23]|nr:MAG: 6-phosphofructokinase [Chloroflexi bacterium 44-23]